MTRLECDGQRFSEGHAVLLTMRIFLIYTIGILVDLNRRTCEAHLPTKSAAAEANSRVPGSDAVEGGAACSQAAPGQRTLSPGGLMKERATLPREERLRKRVDFERLYRIGVKVERGGVILFSRLGGPGRRVGVSASRRIGGSVKRNQARRRLREAYRLNKRLLPDNVDVLLVARPRVLTQTFAETCRDVTGGFRRVRGRGTSDAGPGSST